jgi:chromosome segregation ATPase
LADQEQKVTELEDRIVSEHADAFSQKSELDRLNALYEDASLTASSRQIEIAQRETDIDRLTTDLAALRNQRNEADRKLRELTADNKALREALKAETRKAEEASRRIETLLADLSDREDRIERREQEIARLKGKAGDVAAKDDGDAASRIAAERDRLERKLAKLAGENRKLKSQGTSSGGDDALLREQLQELAAQMVHLTATLEGPQSPIRKAIESAQASSGEGTTISLAERIKALREASERSRSQDADLTDAPEPVKGNG